MGTMPRDSMLAGCISISHASRKEYIFGKKSILINFYALLAVHIDKKKYLLVHFYAFLVVHINHVSVPFNIPI